MVRIADTGYAVFFALSLKKTAVTGKTALTPSPHIFYINIF